MNAFVEVIQADGSSQRHFIGAEQAILGSSPGARISLPSAPELEPEHILISPQKDGCWLSVAAGARTPVLVRGQRFEQGVLKYGTEVAVGNLRIHVDRTDSGASAQGTSGGTKLMMILAIPVLYWLFVSDVEPALPSVTSAKPPSLFKDVAAECTADTAEDAIIEAIEANDTAQARSERYPFDNRDGVKAVQLFGTAESCFEIAGRMNESKQARREKEILRLRIEEDYRTHLLALERYLKSGSVKSALEEARALQHLLGEREDRYTLWLSSVEKKLSLSYSKRKRR